MDRNALRLLDVAIGSVLVVAAAAFGVAGFVAGLAGAARGWGPHAGQWYLAALVLALSAGAVALDELRHGPQAVETWLGNLLLIGALAVGTVGFVLGMANKDYVTTWQVSAVVLAVLALTALLDHLRLQAARLLDPFAGLAALFGLLALVAGIVGFVLGVTDRAYADVWLNAAVVSGSVTFAWDVVAAHRAVLHAQDVRPAAITAPRHAA